MATIFRNRIKFSKLIKSIQLQEILEKDFSSIILAINSLLIQTFPAFQYECGVLHMKLFNKLHNSVIIKN